MATIYTFYRMCTGGRAPNQQNYNATISYSSTTNRDNSVTYSNFKITWNLAATGYQNYMNTCPKENGACTQGCCNNAVQVQVRNNDVASASPTFSTVASFSTSYAHDSRSIGTFSIPGSFTLQPGGSVSRTFGRCQAVGCSGGVANASFTVTNNLPKPQPSPPSIGSNCYASTANGNTLYMQGTASYGYCENQVNSSSYAVYDNAAMTGAIRSGGGLGGVITGLSPNTRYWASFSVSNGCYSRFTTCSAVTVTPNTLSEATPISFDKGKVRLAVTNGGGEYEPTTKIYVRPCAGGATREVATSTTKSVEYVEFDGLEPETCYNIYAVTTTTAGSYTGNTVTITTPKKGICIAEFTKIEPGMDDETLEAYADMCYEWETTKLPATIVVRYQVKDGYDTTWYETEPMVTNEDTGTYCFTIHNLYPNQTVYQTYIHTETDEATYDSPMREFMTPLVPEPANNNCQNFFYLTELLCQSVKKLYDGNKKIYANPYSQALCDPYSDDPTMLTLWSRLLRLDHAVFCVISRLAVLTAAKEGQYLVGEIGWTDILKEIDDTNTDDAWKLATSDAIYRYIQEKLKSVWHYDGTVDALVYQLSDLDSLPDATSAIVTSEDAIYRKVDGEWVKSTAEADEIHNLGVWHINMASNTEAGIVIAESAWYSWEGNWQPLDADLTAYEKIVDSLFEKKDQMVMTPDGENPIAISVTDKDEFDCDELDEKRNIVFITEPMTLPSPQYHLITFNTEDGTTIQPQQVLDGKLPQKPANPTRTGYTFVEWQEDGETFDWTLPIKADHTLDAVWQPNLVTVTFDLNGGTGEQPSAVDLYYGQTLSELPDGTGITKLGGTFVGWTRNGEDFVITDPILGDTVLVAKWQMEEITITFDPQTGEDPTVITTEYGKFVEAPTVEREDYILINWTTEPTGGDVFDPDVAVTANKTYYAQWVNEYYTVTFDTDGGSEIEAVKVKYNTKVAKPTDPTKEGFAFNNWTLNGVVYDFDNPVTSNITLLANWITVWDVTFDLNGGEGDIENQKVKDGEYATKPDPDPTNGDCPFEGWKEEGQSGGG